MPDSLFVRVIDLQFRRNIAWNLIIEIILVLLVLFCEEPFLQAPF